MSLEEAADKVADAILVEGAVPRFHREVMRRHREEWPTLWHALDDLLAVIADSRKEK